MKRTNRLAVMFAVTWLSLASVGLIGMAVGARVHALQPALHPDCPRGIGEPGHELLGEDGRFIVIETPSGDWIQVWQTFPHEFVVRYVDITGNANDLPYFEEFWDRLEAESLCHWSE